MTAAFPIVRLVALVLVGIAVGVFVGLKVLSGAVSTSAPAEQTAPPPRAAVPVVPTLYDGPDYRLKSRVFNLQDANARRYAKMAITLRFGASKDTFEKMAGEAFTKAGADFEKELAPEKDFIDDTLTAVISSKSLADLLTNDGKELLKQQIMTELNKGLHHEPSKLLGTAPQIVKVFFTDFVIQ